MIDLLKLGQQIEGLTNQGVGWSDTYGISMGDGLGDRIQKYVEKVREVSEKYGCSGFSISVGFPFGVSASFRFE